uniref:Uncharacterized protein n=1 Tax=Tetranychus urticae TaxID=32264 RepID=T1K118_TETUR
MGDKHNGRQTNQNQTASTVTTVETLNIKNFPALSPPLVPILMQIFLTGLTALESWQKIMGGDITKMTRIPAYLDKTVVGITTLLALVEGLCPKNYRSYLTHKLANTLLLQEVTIRLLRIASMKRPYFDDLDSYDRDADGNHGDDG